MKTEPTIYSYRVTIRQPDIPFRVGIDFGSQTGWGDLLKRYLRQALDCAYLVEVTPLRRTKALKRKVKS